MKRLAVLTAMAFGPGVGAVEPEAPLYPASRSAPQIAPTLPQVPRPQLSGTDLVPGSAGRAEVTLPQLPSRHHIRPTVKVEAATEAPKGGLPARGATGGTTTQPTSVQPGPGMPAYPVPPVPDVPAPLEPAPPAPGAPGCAAEGHAAAHRSCWSKIAGWWCYRPSHIWLGFHPTPYQPPFHTQFLCEERAGCGPGGCGVAGHHGPAVGPDAAVGAAARPGIGSRLMGRGKVQPGYATAGETIPGYRLAAPENPSVTGQPVPPVVTGTSYKVPTGK